MTFVMRPPQAQHHRQLQNDHENNSENVLRRIVLLYRHDLDQINYKLLLYHIFLKINWFNPVEVVVYIQR